MVQILTSISYVLNNPILYGDALGLRVNYGNLQIGNPFVLANLERLNQQIVNQGIPDEKFELMVTGGDRYIDDAGKHRELGDDAVVKGSDPKSPHLIDYGARAVDIRVTGVSADMIDKALKATDFVPCSDPKTKKDRCRDYPANNAHTHLWLPNEKRYYYGFRTR
jgi:hypothetical protein